MSRGKLALVVALAACSGTPKPTYSDTRYYRCREQVFTCRNFSLCGYTEIQCDRLPEMTWLPEWVPVKNWCYH